MIQILNIALKIQKRVNQVSTTEITIDNLKEKYEKYKGKFSQAQRFILQTLTKASKKTKTMSQCNILNNFVVQDVLFGINFNDFYVL